MYSVSEVAKMLNVSRVTIYRNIETIELQHHVTEVKKIKYVDDKGFELLKEKLCNSNKIIYDIKTCNIETDNLLHEKVMLQNGIEHLKRELDNKEEHINTLKSETVMLQGVLQQLQETNKDLTRLLENSQILLKNEQQKHMSLLEDAQAREKRSFWSVFKRQ